MELGPGNSVASAGILATLSKNEQTNEPANEKEQIIY